MTKDSKYVYARPADDKRAHKARREDASGISAFLQAVQGGLTAAFTAVWRRLRESLRKFLVPFD